MNINDVAERIRERQEQRTRVALDAGHALRRYLLNPTVNVPSDALEEALSANVQLLKALAELKRDHAAIGLQLRLKARLRRVAEVVGAALGDQGVRMAWVPPTPPTGARFAERGISLGEPLEKSGQPGEIP